MLTNVCKVITRPHLQESMFQNYPSIANKGIHAEAAGEDAVWVATPKIHGTNMSVIVARDESIRYARRNGLLGVADSHYGHERVLPSLASWHDVLDVIPGRPSLVRIYGEFYGGGYPHPDVPRCPSAKLIQRGVWYRPDNAFIAFDIWANGSFLNLAETQSVCATLGIPVVQTAFTGTFDQVLEWTRAHARDNVTPLPDGLPVIDDNGGEGWVMRPARETVFGDSRLLLKVKNPAFLEGGEPKLDHDRVVIEGLDELAAYTTPARAASVASKGDPTMLTFARLQEFAADIEADVLSDLAPDAKAVLYPKGPERKALRGMCFAAAKQHILNASK